MLGLGYTVMYFLFPFYILDDDDFASYLLNNHDSKHIDHMLFNPFDLNHKKDDRFSVFARYKTKLNALITKDCSS